MTWISGKWADVAIGDDVLGADGYAWRVTDGAINYFGPSGKGESLRVTMARPIIGGADAERDMVRTGDVFADKPTKYIEGEGVRRILSCVYCLRSDVEDPCKLHAPEPATVAPVTMCREGDKPPHPIGGPGCLLEDWEDSPSLPMSGIPVPADVDGPCVCGPFQYCHRNDCHGGEPTPAVITATKPYVEYDDAERAAAAALKGAGLQMTVIERQMTLDGLTEHIGNVHGEPLPGAGGNLTRIELRSKLADLHFQLHEHEQPRGQRWEPRGSTAHVHPVMDRPTGDPEPTSFRVKR